MLRDNEDFKSYILNGDERIQVGVRYYGNSIKNQLDTMEKNWRKAHAVLGETGQSITDKDQIQKGSGLYVIWKEKVEKMCSFYFQLKLMVGERLFVTKNAVSNSINSLFVRNLLDSGRSAVNFEAEVFSDTQLDVMMGGNDQFLNDEEDVEEIDGFDNIGRFDEVGQPDESESQIDSALLSRFFTQDSVSATVSETPRSRPTSTSRSTPQNAVATPARRRPGVGGVLGDFAEGLRSASAASADRKRIRDADIQATNREDIQARAALDRRLGG